MLFANSFNFYMSSVDLFIKLKYILAFFYWKVYEDLKYHTNHITDYFIFKVSSRIYNINIQYIVLRVEISLAILSKVSVIDTIKLPRTRHLFVYKGRVAQICAGDVQGISYPQVGSQEPLIPFWGFAGH